ncbi:MAG: hypothetical protein WCA44_18675 [Acidobacteriaceae bacterium]
MPSPGKDPNLDPKQHLSDESVREGYELTDASTGGIVVFLIGLAVSVGIFFAVCYVFGTVINGGLNKADGPTSKWKAPFQVAPTKALRSNPDLEQEQLSKLTKQYPFPQLQLDDGNTDLAALHDREDLLLNYYSWVDESKGTVRIPIERAMQLIAQQGLPVAPAEEQQPLMTGDARPTVQMPLTDGFAPTAYDQQVQANRAAQLQQEQEAEKQ